MGAGPVARHQLAAGWRWAELDGSTLCPCESFEGEGFGLPMLEILLFPSLPLAFPIRHEGGGKWTCRHVSKARLCVPYTLLQRRLGLCLGSLSRLSGATWPAPSSSHLWVCRLHGACVAQIAVGGTSASKQRCYLGWGWYSLANSSLGHHFCSTTLASFFFLIYYFKCLRSFSSIGGAAGDGSQKYSHIVQVLPTNMDWTC